MLKVTTCWLNDNSHHKASQQKEHEHTAKEKKEFQSTQPRFRKARYDKHSV